MTRIENALAESVGLSVGTACPPRLRDAVHHAVFPGGARIRPRLCLAVGAACGEDSPPLLEAAAVAVELLHCASLVHDDLPCFDDAPLRRGKASVHRAYGERLAVLAGDALIVLAFETLARRIATAPARVSELMLLTGRAVGLSSGLIAGQAWECEPKVSLSEYHGAKTGALFVAASCAGAVAAGAEASEWRSLGARLGEAYQVADDLRDAVAQADELGKPVRRDAVLGRPSAVMELGVTGSMQRLRDLVEGAVAAIPECEGAGGLEALIRAEARRLVPAELARRVA